MEYSQCHAQAISEFQNMFPSINMPSMQTGNSLHQILDGLIKNLPHPTVNEVNHSLQNMKSVIDHQELRIQKNMMEIELENLCMENNTNMEKKISSGTTTSEHIWEDYSVDHIGEEWGVFHRTESIERDLSSFLD